MYCARARRAVVVAALGLGLSACGAAPVDPNLADIPTGPLTGMPTCGPTPPAMDPQPDIEGLVFPEGAEIDQVTETAPLINVTAYVSKTPVQIRLELEGRDDIEMLVSEDEILEAELLVTDGTHRTFVKARAICDVGSILIGVVAPETDAEGVPVPTGAATP